MPLTYLKYQNRRNVIIYVIVSVVSFVVFWQQNCTIQKENAEIKHRLDVRDAYKIKGLIDGGKDREKAYFDIKEKYERILEHCKTHTCELPNDLTVLPATRNFESFESLLVKEKE